MPITADEDFVDDLEVIEPSRPASEFVRKFAADRLPSKQVQPTVVEPLDPTLVGITDAILKSPASLDKAITETGHSGQLVPRLLVVSLVGFLMFGIAMSLVFSSADMWPKLLPMKKALTTNLSDVMAFEHTPVGASRMTPWLNGQAFKLMTAYAIGLIGATCICLPSLYFYGLLAGVRMTMLDVVQNALKAKATTAIALVGILPVYAALALGVILFETSDFTRTAVFHFGLALPFIAGIAGCRSLYRGFGELPFEMPAARRVERTCFLRRLVLSWSVIFTAVSPVMIHELWALMN